MIKSIILTKHKDGSTTAQRRKGAVYLRRVIVTQPNCFWVVRPGIEGYKMYHSNTMDKRIDYFDEFEDGYLIVMQDGKRVYKLKSVGQ